MDVVDQRPTILGVCDRPAQVDLLGQTLRAAGFAWRGTGNAVAAAREVAAGSVDAVVVDLRDAVAGGATLCRAVRACRRPVPILAVVDQAEVSSIVDYLDAGADDCLARPFARAEFLARVRALVRRSRAPHRTVRRAAPAVLNVGDVWLNPVTHQAGRGPREVPLTFTEFRLLETFLRRPGHVLSAELLLRLVWNDDDPPSRNTVAAYVSYLRRKLETGEGPQLLHTVRGMGYVFKAGRTS